MFDVVYDPFERFMNTLTHSDTVKVILSGVGESEFATEEIHKAIQFKIEEAQEIAKAKSGGRLVEVVRCGECRKIMTEECILCSFDIDGYCTGGPDNDQFCSFGEAAEKAIAEVGGE